MRKAVKSVGICVFVASVLWAVGLIQSRFALNNRLIGPHIAADSGDEVDHTAKYSVKDKVNEYLADVLRDATNVDQAGAYLLQKLPVIRDIALKGKREYEIRSLLLDLLGRLENLIREE